MGTIVFTSGMQDAMLQRRNHPGAPIIRVGEGDHGAAEDVRKILESLDAGYDVIVPISDRAVMGWRAPEGTAIKITDEAISRHGSDSELITNAYMRSPQWSMTQANPDPEFDPVIGDEPAEPESDPEPGRP